MAKYKVSLAVLSQQKSEYDKVVSNLNAGIETLKNVQKNLGTDKMLEGARESVNKLIGVLETRSATLQKLSKALEETTGQYRNSETKAVAKSNNFRAHKQDFYGRPAKVASAGVSAGTVAGSAGATVQASAVNVSYSQTNISYEEVSLQQTYNAATEYSAAAAAATADSAAGGGIDLVTSGVAAAAAIAGAGLGVGGTLLAGKLKEKSETPEQALERARKKVDALSYDGKEL